MVLGEIQTDFEALLAVVLPTHLKEPLSCQNCMPVIQHLTYHTKQNRSLFAPSRHPEYSGDGQQWLWWLLTPLAQYLVLELRLANLNTAMWGQCLAIPCLPTFTVAARWTKYPLDWTPWRNLMLNWTDDAESCGSSNQSRGINLPHKRAAVAAPWWKVSKLPIRICVYPTKLLGCPILGI